MKAFKNEVYWVYLSTCRHLKFTYPKLSCLPSTLIIDFTEKWGLLGMIHWAITEEFFFWGNTSPVQLGQALSLRKYFISGLLIVRWKVLPRSSFLFCFVVFNFTFIKKGMPFIRRI